MVTILIDYFFLLAPELFPPRIHFQLFFPLPVYIDLNLSFYDFKIIFLGFVQDSLLKLLFDKIILFVICGHLDVLSDQIELMPCQLLFVHFLKAKVLNSFSFNSFPSVRDLRTKWVQQKSVPKNRCGLLRDRESLYVFGIKIF